jgi:diguanylate cyclase
VRVTALVVVAGYVVALLAGPSGTQLWREFGLQVTALSLITAHAVGRAVLDRANRRRLAPLAGWMGVMTLGNALANGPEAGAPPGPTSASTVVFALVFPFALVTVVRAHRGGWRPNGLGQLMEPLVSTLAIAAGFTSFLLPQAIEASDGDVLTVLTVLAFPLLDLVVVAVVVVAVARSGASPERMSGWLALGLLLFLSADWRYALGLARGDLGAGSPIDAMWVLGCAVVGLLAAAGPPSPRSTDTWGLASLGVCLISAGAAVSVLAIGTETPLPRAGVALAAACVVGALVRLLAAYLEMRGLAEAHRLARTDELTGLANRRVLHEVLDAVLLPGAEPAALLLADLDRFKEVNDTFGHEAGDRLLVAVADRLREVMPEGSTLVRLGGDEFAAVVRLTDATGGVQLARAFTEAVSTLDTPGDTVVGASVGVVETGRERGLTGGELMRRADVAMYRAKNARTTVHRYSDEPPRAQTGYATDRYATVHPVGRETIGSQWLTAPPP